MAVRFSGSCTIRVRIDNDGDMSNPATYHVNIAACGRPLWSGYIRGAASDRRPIDAPPVYDDIARAALSFADCGEAADLPAALTESGTYLVTRRKDAPCK